MRIEKVYYWLIILTISLLPAIAFSEFSSSGPWLVFDLGMPHNLRVNYAGVDFQVEVSADGGERFEQAFRRIYAGTAWLPCAVDLSRFGGKEVILRVLADPVYGQAAGNMIHWGSPRITAGALKAWEPYGGRRSELDLRKLFGEAEVYLLTAEGEKKPAKRGKDGLGYEVPGTYYGSISSAGIMAVA